MLHQQRSWELIQRSHCCSIHRCFHFDKSLQDAVAAAQIEVNIVYDWSQKWNLIWMLTRAKFIHYPETTTANGALLLPSEESKLELTTPLGYLAFFFNTNIRQIKQSLSSSFCVIGGTVLTSWGWRRLTKQIISMHWSDLRSIMQRQYGSLGYQTSSSQLS